MGGEVISVSMIALVKAGGTTLQVLLSLVVLMKVVDLQKTVNSLTERKRWVETCEEKHEALNNRVDALWSKVFGGIL